MITGVLLAIARISGETAPLLFTALNNQFWSTDMNAPMANLPVVIFQFALSPYKDWQDLAWAGALLITVTILIINITARLLAGLGSQRTLTIMQKNVRSYVTTAAMPMAVRLGRRAGREDVGPERQLLLWSVRSPEEHFNCRSTTARSRPSSGRAAAASPPCCAS